MIDVVGIGLDGAAGLSEKVQALVEKASLLIGSDRHLSYFPTSQAQSLILGNIISVIEEIQQRLKTEEAIVILVTGDPLFFGLGRLLVENLPKEKLRFHPHLTSIQLAFNSIKIPWQDAKIISLHGREVDELITAWQQGIKKIALLTDGDNNPSAIARLYLNLGIASAYDFWVCENLGSFAEKVNHFSYTEIGSLASLEKNSFAALNVVILIRHDKFLAKDLEIEKLPMLGLTDSYFVSFSDRPGLMTKREIRLIVLGELALAAKQIVWDIGAGTGSVAIEIARLCPSSRIYAIEKTAMGITLIKQNCQRLKVNNVNAINGSAPEILAQLPQPNRIFIGGSGGNLTAILDYCWESLAVDGVIVLSLATLEHINISFNWLKNHQLDYRLTQVQISHSVGVGNLTRFAPLNPVTIITVYKVFM